MNYIIWGTGHYYNKYKKYLSLPLIDIVALIDSNVEKQGTKIDGINVIPPYKGIQLEADLIIAVKDDVEIQTYLKEHQYKRNIFNIKTFPFEFVSKERDRLIDCIKPTKERVDKKIVFDIIGGSGWAGTERWAYNASGLLKSAGYDSIVLGDTSQDKLADELESNTIRIERTSDYLERFLSWVGKNLPMVYISNFWDESQKYAIIAKKLFKEKFKYVQVFHVDKKSIYDEWVECCNDIDATLCVSKKICEKCITLMPKRESNIFFATMAYKVNMDIRSYSSEILQIGWAGRLVKQQKRADLIPELVNLLDEQEILYHMEIAGKGECLSDIQQYINQNNKRVDIEYVGYIASDHIMEFWKHQDIFLNISTEEGASLSMLEAMSCGCVPVVTDVSGVGDVVIDGWNGFVVSVDNWKEIAVKIKYLSEHKDLLEIMGNRCKKIIVERCSEKVFTEKLITIIQG